jgi:glycosyltransferase involved in cell wall biosynthesis
MCSEAKKTFNIFYTTSFAHMAGGGQWSLYYLIKHLNKKLFQPVVLCPEEGELPKKMRAIGADVILLNMGRIRHLNIFVAWKLITTMKSLKIHLVHTDSSTETFYAGIAAKIVGIPLVWHIRVSDSEWFFDILLSFLSTRLILVAKALGSRFRWLEGRKKMVTVHNAIDLEEFDKSPIASSIRKEFNIDTNTLILACIGRVEERKGHEYLIHAVKNIDDIKLIIAGKGEEAYFKKLQGIIDDLKVSDRIIFAGYREDIPSILKEIDILVFPTISGEGFSRVILEAMAAGKPVIATDQAGNPEAVIDGVTGYIVPVRDSKSLAERIDDLIKDKEKREKMGVAGREGVTSNYNIRNQVEQIQNLYIDVLKQESA